MSWIDILYVNIISYNAALVKGTVYQILWSINMRYLETLSAEYKDKTMGWMNKMKFTAVLCA